MNDEPRLQELGDRLERAIAAEQSAGRARVAPRPRAALRMRLPVVIGLGAAAAVAAVVVALVSGGGGTSPRVAEIAPVRSPGGSARGQDVADIVARARVRFADGGRRGRLSRVLIFSGGHLSPTGSLVDVGRREFSDDSYDSPSGIVFIRGARYAPDARVTRTSFAVRRPVPGATVTTLTVLDPGHRTYSVSRLRVVGSSRSGAGLGVPDTASEVRRALRGGHVTELGRLRVLGRPAIALELPLGPGEAGQRHVLYVDAATDRPLRFVDDEHGGPFPLVVSDWMPITAAGVARARRHAIPAGYRRVRGDDG